jgi:hypothetical protein
MNGRMQITSPGIAGNRERERNLDVGRGGESSGETGVLFNSPESLASDGREAKWWG